MDQNKKSIQELRTLQVNLKEVASLQNEFFKAEERIREGLSDAYFYCEQEPVEEEEHRKTACVSENCRKAERIALALKISRVVLIVIFLIVLYTCIFLFSSENKVPDWIGVLAPVGVFTCIGYWIATVITIRNMDIAYNFSAKQQVWIAEGARIDEETMERNMQAYAAAREKSYKEQREWIAELKRDLPEDRKKLAQVQAAIAASDVVGNKDKNLETVGFLIHQLANRRANSVQEALLQYDNKKTAEEEERKRIAHLQFMYDLQQQANGQRAVQEAEAYMRQTFHNMELQKQARRQTEELERIRRELEK